MNVYIPILIILFLSIVGVTGDFFLKLSGAGPRYVHWPYFILGFIVYASTAFGWFYVMKHIKLSTLGVYYSLFTITLLVLLGVFYFKEHLNLYEILGIVFAVAAIILLSRFS